MSNKDNKSNNTSSVLTRDEFRPKFKGDSKRLTPQPKGAIGQRWAFLYNLNKLKEAKLTERRMTKQAESDYLFTHQCTFSPKTNKLPQYLLRKDEKSANQLQKSLTTDMLNRQEAWISKLQMKKEALKQSNNNQLTTQCNFSPATNTATSVEKLNIAHKVESVINNFSSYKSYIERVSNKRKALQSQTERTAKLESGSRWRRGMLSVKSHYDYSQHEYAAQRLTPKSGGHKMTLYKNKRGDEESCPTEVQSRCSPLKKNKTFESNVLFTEQTSFRNALNQLHRELLAIKLMKDE